MGQTWLTRRCLLIHGIIIWTMIVKTVLHGIVNENEQDKKLYILNDCNCVFVYLYILKSGKKTYIYASSWAGELGF